jgi:hypothetical protein
MIYSKDNLRQIFQQPFNQEGWQNMLRHYFHASELKAERERIDDTPDDEKGYYLGAIDTTDNYRIGLFYYQIQHGNVARKRVGLRNLVRSFINPNWGEFDAALVVFDSGSVWRLSFVCDIKGENTAAKRFTYVFGESDNYYNTPVGRFDALQRNGISFENIKDAFSVERLNKDFFNGYKERYVKFLNHINDDTKENRDYVKKLLGRLVFLQFLQKKGWLGVPANQQGWNGGDKFYLNHLIERNEGNDRLLSDVLEPLFFNTLNERRVGDLADSRLGDSIKIPYLNGGLFDKDELDKKDIDFPYDYFKELMDFFAMYNFTIDENDPEDSEIGIDPEMLGHIFENLLEDNKDKGAFYTPKEIVQYMSKESVAQYLKSNTPEELHTAIDSLIKQRVVEPVLQNKENARLVNKTLVVVKVCDPAIGSGAFPMGVLNVLFDCRHLLYGFIGKNEDFSYAKVKRDIIQNNIYGVDIEKGAVDIARLRFWLALVVDENEPQPLPNLDYKIMCGDSLLHRFPLDAPFQNVLKDYNQKNGTHYTLDDYRQWVYDYTDISDHTQKDYFRQRIEDIKHAFKTELSDKEKGKIAKVRGTIENLKMEDLFGGKRKENEKKIKALQKELKTLEQQREEIESNIIYDQAFEWRFEFPALLDEAGNFTGFDIVIGNPPFLRIQGIRKVNPIFADYLSNHYKSATGSFDLYVTFVEMGLNIINRNGIVNFIMPTKWTNSAFGKGLRQFIFDTKSYYKIINFGAYQVFNASTYTGLQWFKPNSMYMRYIELNKDLSSNEELKQFLDSLSDDNATIIGDEKLRDGQWVLTNNIIADILNKLEQHPRRIKDVFDRIFCGLQTSKDDVYFLYECKIDNRYVVGKSKQLGRKVQIETGLVKPLLKGEDVHRYDTIKTDRYVIFPYKIENGKAILYTENELSELFPYGYAYLKECEDTLRGREHGKLEHDDCWYKYIYPKNLVLFDNEKLVAPDISMGGNFAYDYKGEFYQTTTVYGYIKKQSVHEDYKFWLALLNSRLCWWYMANTGTVLANGFFRYKPDYINPFPVPSYKKTCEVQDIICQLVDYIVFLNDKSTPNILSHTSNDRIISHIMEIMDMVIYELYFEQHMKDCQIDVISYLKSYPWDNMLIDIARNIENFYLWYQQSDNLIRQRMMLLETRSKNLIYQIHSKSKV